MESLGWRQRRGSSPAARRGARQRAGLTPVSASNTLSCERETLTQNSPDDQKPLTVITVSTAISQMSLPKLAFEVWPEFPFISERLAIRDFSPLSCQRVTCTPVQSAMSMARRSPLRCGQAMLERRLLWIREFESSTPAQPVRSPLCSFRVWRRHGARRSR